MYTYTYITISPLSKQRDVYLRIIHILQAKEEKQLTGSSFGCEELLSAVDAVPSKQDLTS